MLGNLAANGPLRQLEAYEFFGGRGDGQINKSLRVCFASIADEARAAAARLVERVSPSGATALRADTREDDVNSCILFLQHDDGKRRMFIRSEWEVDPQENPDDQDIHSFSIIVNAHADRPMQEWQVELDIGQGTTSYVVDLATATIAFRELCNAGGSEFMEPLSDKHVRAMLGAAVELLQKTPTLIAAMSPVAGT